MAVRIDGSSSITNTTCSDFFMIPSSCWDARELLSSLISRIGPGPIEGPMAKIGFSDSSRSQCSTNATEQALISKWFSQELNCASFECLHSHPRISVSRNEDDRYTSSLRYQFRL